MLYTYRAKLDRVIDGDTVVLEVDLGFHMNRQAQPYRLLRIDAPEMREPEGVESRNRLRDHLDGKDLVVTTQRRDNFGRWLAELYANGENISDWMVKSKLAVYKEY